MIAKSVTSHYLVRIPVAGILQGPRFADDNEQVAEQFARAFGAEIIPHEELLAKVAVPGELEQG